MTVGARPISSRKIAPLAVSSTNGAVSPACQSAAHAWPNTLLVERHDRAVADDRHPERRAESAAEERGHGERHRGALPAVEAVQEVQEHGAEQPGGESAAV